MVARIVMLGLCICTYASFANDDVRISLVSVDKSIHPQEPLSLELSLELSVYKGRPVRSVFVNNDDMRMRVYASSGSMVSESKPWEWRCNEVPRYTWLAKLDKSELHRAEKSLVFNEWCSTSLLPGDYKVTCDISELGIVYVGESVSSRKFFSPPIQVEFSFRVLEKDEGAVRKRYDALLAKASEKVGGRDHKEELARAVELITYSREPLALSYQLKLLSGVVPMYVNVFNDCNAIDLALHLSEQNRPEVAKGLADVFDELRAGHVQMEQVSRSFLSELVLWTVHELHSHGNAEIKEVTEPIVKTFAKPPDPRNQF